MFEALGFLLNSIFWPLTTLPPALSVFLLAFLLTLLVIIVNIAFIDKNAIKDLKEKMNMLREELIELQKQGNLEKAKEVLNEITKQNLNYMKKMVKVLVISIIAISLILPWVQYTYKDMPVAKLPMALPYFGSSLNWFIWYFIASLAIGWVLRKVMGIDYG